MCFVPRARTRKLSPLLVTQRQTQTRKISVCSRRKCEGKQTYLYMGNILKSLHSRWVLSVRFSMAPFIGESSLLGGYRTKLTDIKKACRVNTATHLLGLFEPNGPNVRPKCHMRWNSDKILWHCKQNVGMLLRLTLKIRDIRCGSRVSKAVRD